MNIASGLLPIAGGAALWYLAPSSGDAKAAAALRFTAAALASYGAYQLISSVSRDLAPTIKDGGVGAGGVAGHVLEAVLGSNDQSEIGPVEVIGQADAPLPPSSGKPIDHVSGRIVQPAHEGNANRALFGSTYLVRVELQNTSSKAWRGALVFDAHEDYLVHDEISRVVVLQEIPANTSLLVTATLRIAATFMLRNPRIYLTLSANSKQLDRIAFDVL